MDPLETTAVRRLPACSHRVVAAVTMNSVRKLPKEYAVDTASAEHAGHSVRSILAGRA